MNLLLKVNNYNKKRFTCAFDTLRVSIKSISDSVSTEIDLKDGCHTLVVEKCTWFDTPLCYLNIINPLFYLWQIKYSSIGHIGYDESYAALKIHFCLKQENSSLSLILNKESIDDCYYVYNFQYVSSNGLKISSIENKSMDLKKILRYKLTYILSNLFYGLFLDLIFLLDVINNKEEVFDNIVFMAIITLFSAISIYRTIKLKSVNRSK